MEDDLEADDIKLNDDFFKQSTYYVVVQIDERIFPSKLCFLNSFFKQCHSF